MGDVVNFERRDTPPKPPPAPRPTAGRVPPHDLDAEAAVLSAVLIAADHDGLALAAALASIREIMQDPSCGQEDREAAAQSVLGSLPSGGTATLDKVLAVLKPEHFYSEANARVFQAIQTLAASKTPVDLVTVASWLRGKEWLQRMGGTAYLAQLADGTPAVGHVDAHAAKVVEKWEARQLIATCQRVAADLYYDYGDHAAYKASVRAEFGRITAPAVKIAGASVGAAMKDAFRRVDDAERGIVAGVRYGFDEIDARAGLLARKRQTILGGRPSMGKTQLAWETALNVAATPRDEYGVGEAVYIASWEMPRDALVFRGVCIEARVDTNTVEQGRMTKDDLARMTQAAQWMSTLPIIIDDERCTPQELRERVLAHKEMFASGKARNHNGHLFPKCRLQLVMVDYLQKGKWPTTLPNNAPRHERVAAISNGLVEEVAKGCDVATLVLAQVNRAVEGKNVKDRRPTLADLKESGDIEQDADTVLFVHRESFYLRNQTPLEHRNVAEVIVTKGRYGMPDDPVALLGFYRGFFSNEVPRPALEAREERQREQEKEREKAS